MMKDTNVIARGLDADKLVAFGEGMMKAIVDRAPHILGGLVILGVGWLVAVAARLVIDRTLRAARLNKMVAGSRIESLLQALGKGWTASRTIAQLAYLTLLLMTLNAAATHWGMSGVGEALASVIGYVPRAISALLLLAGGAYVAGAVKKSVGSVLRELRNPAAGVLESLAEWAILLVCALVAFDVLGADLSFITSNLTMLLGAVFVLVVFLSCWSMRLPAEHLVANYYLRRMLSVGDHVETDVHAGTVLEFQPLGLILRDAKGDEHFIPALQLMGGLRRRKGLTPS